MSTKAIAITGGVGGLAFLLGIPVIGFLGILALMFAIGWGANSVNKALGSGERRKELY